MNVLHTESILKRHPLPLALDQSALSDCVDACFDCAQSCTSCADACLGEGRPDELVRCIRLNLDCADICDTMARVASRQTGYEPRLVRELLHACALACKLCGEECWKHAGRMEHCRVCAEACERCQEACGRLMAAAAA
jgi:hypothetical protein